MLAFCIADEDTVRGFRLAGVPGEAVTTPQEAMAAFERARVRPACALLLLSADVCAGLGAALAAFRARSDRPLVVELPRPGAPASQRGALERLVRSLLGVRLEDEP